MSTMWAELITNKLNELRSINSEHAIEAERVLSIGIPLAWMINQGLVKKLTDEGIENMQYTFATLMDWIAFLTQFPDSTVKQWWAWSDAINANVEAV